MNKVKWSFSLIFSIFLVGILSNAAFASDPYNLKIVQKDLGLEVSFTGNSNDIADVQNRQFDLVLSDGATNLNTYGPVVLDNAKRGTFNIPSGDLTIGKVYSVKLYHTDDTNHTTQLSVSSGVVIDNVQNSKKMYQSPDPHVDVNGSGLVNANQTGFNNTRKQRDGQKVHGFYQNNTNSCASCHQTHTANNDNLLFKNGVYSTCSACHDGTTGASNTFTAITTKTANSIDGTFDVSADVAHGSLHQADGSLKITSAPGGNSDSTSAIWNQEFDCASCHASHGGGSAQENNLSLDPLGWGGVQYVANGTKDQKNGKLFKNILIHDTIPLAKGDPYILVRTTATGVTATKTNIGYIYYRAGVRNGDPIIQTYRWDGNGNGYVPDYSLWLRDKGYKDPSSPFSNADTVLKDTSSKEVTNNITVIWRDGFAFGSGIATVKSANIAIGIDVETTDDIKSLYDSTNVSYIPDSGVEMTKYCAACHTDYSTTPATGDSGTLTAYHRHPSVTDQLTCVRCHFAHGSKAQIMKGSDDQLAKTTDTLSDTNHSSALRRYVDMDSCYTSGCHSNDSSNALYLEWSN